MLPADQLDNPNSNTFKFQELSIQGPRGKTPQSSLFLSDPLQHFYAGTGSKETHACWETGLTHATLHTTVSKTGN